jgi:hypothetical protein
MATKQVKPSQTGRNKMVTKEAKTNPTESQRVFEAAADHCPVRLVFARYKPEEDEACQPTKFVPTREELRLLGLALIHEIGNMDYFMHLSVSVSDCQRRDYLNSRIIAIEDAEPSLIDELQAAWEKERAQIEKDIAEYEAQFRQETEIEMAKKANGKI